MANTGDTLPRGNSDSNSPKLLVYVDRNVKATMSSSKKGKKFVGKKHTEVVNFYQSKDGTEGSKENEPAFVINREMIDWSVTEKGTTLETFCQRNETFDVDLIKLLKTEITLMELTGKDGTRFKLVEITRAGRLILAGSQASPKGLQPVSGRSSARDEQLKEVFDKLKI